MSANPDRTYESVAPRKCAFLGLGVMGAPMAGHLKRAGHDVKVYNRTSSRAVDWLAAYGGASAPTPREAADECDVVFACVGNDNDLREVTLGSEGAFLSMRPDAIFVDHTTTSAEVARELYERAQERGFHFIDAPVSGGQAGSTNGTLTVMCGGDAEPFEAVKPVIMAYAKAVTRLGGAGAGQLAKMTNQIAIAGLLQGLSEAIAFGQRAGLDMKQVLGVIGKGAAQSWQMDNRGTTMIEDKFDFGFAVDLMRKDLALCLAEARRNGARLPVAALVDQFYADLQAAGGGRRDSSSLIRRLR
jgi:3-hydroxyisobutyrate dehydrogenase-like beta-hydroxyacid dehydrogenase